MQRADDECVNLSPFNNNVTLLFLSNKATLLHLANFPFLASPPSSATIAAVAAAALPSFCLRPPHSTPLVIRSQSGWWHSRHLF
jgi:hypothetical protein